MIYKKSIHLNNWCIDRDVRTFVPPKDIEVKWEIPDKEMQKNEECYATLTGHNRKLLDTTAAQMPLLSERVRTLNSLPKFRMVNTKVERIW